MEAENKNFNLEELVALASVALADFSKSKGKRKAKQTDNNDEQNAIGSASSSVKVDSRTRSRKFCGSSYIDRKALERFLRNSPFIQHYALCTHDRDIVCNDAGEHLINVETGEVVLKEVHTHILLYTYDAKTSSAVRKIFDRFSADFYRGSDKPIQNTLMQVCNDMVSQWRYLIHQDEFEKDGKVPYDKSERLCDDISYWENLERTNSLNDSANNRAFSVITDKLQGMSDAQLTLKYGDYYITRSRNFDYVFNKIRRQSDINKQIMPLRELAQLGLSSSHFSDEQINTFYTIYDYLNSQFFVSYGDHINGHMSVNLYLKALEDKKNVEINTKNICQ